MNKFFLPILIALILLFFGCTQSTPVCGDGVCLSEETNPNSNYFCTNDCKIEITETAETEGWAKKVYPCSIKNCDYNNLTINGHADDLGLEADKKCREKLMEKINSRLSQECGRQTKPNCSNIEVEFYQHETFFYCGNLLKKLPYHAEGKVTCTCG